MAAEPRVEAAARPPEELLTIARTWKTGDHLEVRLPLGSTSTRCPTIHGSRPSCTGHSSSRAPWATRGQPIPAPELIAPSARPEDWIRRVGDPSAETRDVEVVAGSPGDWTRVVAEGGLAFRTTGQPRALSLIPLNRVFGQRFAVYWRVRRG